MQIKLNGLKAFQIIKISVDLWLAIDHTSKRFGHMWAHAHEIAHLS